MKINVNDLSKLEEVFSLAQKRCSARIMNAQDAERLGKDIEARLIAAGVCRKNLPGTTAVVVENHGKIASSYRGTPEATRLSMRRGAAAWFVTEVTRVIYSRGYTTLALTDAAKADAANRLSNY